MRYWPTWFLNSVYAVTCVLYLRNLDYWHARQQPYAQWGGRTYRLFHSLAEERSRRGVDGR